MFIYSYMLNEFLKQLGFTDREILVYLCVQESGKLSVTDVARITKINRTTVYSVAKELYKKGVIQEDLSATITYYTALPPEDLRTLYKTEERELEAKKVAIEKAILELQVLPKSKKYSVPKIRFIDEPLLEEFLYKQLPVWIESANKYEDKNWWGYQDVTLLEEYPKWVDYHWEIFPKDYGMRVFSNQKISEEKTAQRITNQNRQVKFWDKSVDFTATHSVLGDYVLFIVTNQHPHYLVETHDTVMANNLREMFKGIWEKI